MKKNSHQIILEDIISMCYEITKMLDSEIIEKFSQNKLIESANNIEDIFFDIIGEEKLSEYRNLKDNILKEKIDSIKIEEIEIEDVKTKDYIVKKIYSENDWQDLKWHCNNENTAIVAIKENNWKIQYDNQFPMKMEIGTEYKIKKEQYYRFIKGTGDLYLKEYKLKNEIIDNIKEIPGFGESIKYHIDNKISLNNSIFRIGSIAWNELINKTKKLYDKGKIRLNEYDKLIVSTKK